MMRIKMLAWLLRIAFFFILALSASLGLAAGEVFGVGAGFAVFLVAVLALQVGIALLAFALSWSDFSAKTGAADGFLATAAELFAFWRAYVLLMPWKAEETDPPSAPDILLIPGYCCNAAMWADFASALRAQGRVVATITLEPPFADIDRLAEQLAREIARLRAPAGAKKLLLVGHSMGGLVARRALALAGAEGVCGLITLATPHHGAKLARYAYGCNGREMEPGSRWLADLPPPPVPTHCFWGGRDEIVSPQESARLDGAAQTQIPLAGHFTLLNAPEILAAVLGASDAA